MLPALACRLCMWLQASAQLTLSNRWRTCVPQSDFQRLLSWQAARSSQKRLKNGQAGGVLNVMLYPVP